MSSIDITALNNIIDLLENHLTTAYGAVSEQRHKMYQALIQARDQAKTQSTNPSLDIFMNLKQALKPLIAEVTQLKNQLDKVGQQLEAL